MKFLSKASSTDRRPATDRLAAGLGWFSIGLGLAELLAPRALARLIGVPDRPWIFRLLGLREVASGVGILQEYRRDEWLWARVGGDVIDLGLLGIALTSDESNPARVEIAAASVLGVTVLDLLAAQECRELTHEPGTIHFRKTINIDRPVDSVYAFWRNFENLPRFMRNLESVTCDGSRSHWIAKGPAGSTVEWEAELLEDIPNHLISWRSLEGSQVDNAGAVRFDVDPDGGGTLVRVDITYRPPAGVFGALVAKLFGRAPEQEVQGDLARFKEVVETGPAVATPAHRVAEASGDFTRDSTGGA